MKDADGVDVVDPTSAEDVLDVHYADALRAARAGREPTATEALERLADALGLDLAYDRRR